MVEKKLVVHIGLPKTGSTTLQKFFFSRYSGYAGKHSPRPDPAGLDRKLHLHYRVFSGNLPASSTPGGASLSSWVKEVARNEKWPLIISNVHLSSWPRGHLTWPTEGKTGPTTAEHPAVSFLSELRQLLPSDIALKLILTLRNQSDFVASLVAELEIAGFFTSNSFQQLLARRDPFMDYYKLVKGLEGVGGAQNLLTLVFEDGIEANISAIANFIDVPGRDTDFDLETKAPFENRKRIGKNSWLSHRPRFPILRTLSGSASWRALRWSRWYSLFQPFVPLAKSFLKKIQGQKKVPFTTEISDAHRLRIRAVYRSSNRLLANHLSRSLSKLGY